MENKLKLEVGKSYRTKGGWKATVKSDDGVTIDPIDVLHYHSEGEHNIWHDRKGNNIHQPEYDLIAPWEDEADTDADAAGADGWIEWHGGECPVPKGPLVDVRHRDGYEYLSQPAGVMAAPPIGYVEFAFLKNRNDVSGKRFFGPKLTTLSCPKVMNGIAPKRIGRRLALFFHALQKR